MVEAFGPLALERAHVEAEDPFLAAMRVLARKTSVWLLVGSIILKSDCSSAETRGEDSKEFLVNRSLLIDAVGDVVARYDKIHMFDVDLEDGESYRESKSYQPGAATVVAETPWGTLGMTVCYDLRFPHLYRTLAHRGASYLAIPSAFTQTTGAAHWHVLMRARDRKRVFRVRAGAMWRPRERAQDLWPLPDRRSLGAGARRRWQGAWHHQRRNQSGRDQKRTRSHPFADPRPTVRLARGPSLGPVFQVPAMFRRTSSRLIGSTVLASLLWAAHNRMRRRFAVPALARSKVVDSAEPLLDTGDVAAVAAAVFVGDDLQFVRDQGQ